MRTAKAEVLENRFVDRLRGEMCVDQQEYDDLCAALGRLADELASEAKIDRDLALVLYSTPQMVWNAYRQALEPDNRVEGLARRLEDMWIELDALVLECLS